MMSRKSIYSTLWQQLILINLFYHVYSSTTRNLLHSRLPFFSFHFKSTRRQAHLCVLNQECTEKEYTKLVEALCAEHNIHLIKVENAKKLGEWVGLCKIDREGNARKVVGCSCVVVKDYGEESEAMSVLLEHFQNRE